jgi:hypothetical protein
MRAGPVERVLGEFRTRLFNFAFVSAGPATYAHAIGAQASIRLTIKGGGMLDRIAHWLVPFAVIVVALLVAAQPFVAPVVAVVVVVAGLLVAGCLALAIRRRDLDEEGRRQ